MTSSIVRKFITEPAPRVFELGLRGLVYFFYKMILIDSGKENVRKLCDIKGNLINVNQERVYVDGLLFKIFFPGKTGKYGMINREDATTKLVSKDAAKLKGMSELDSSQYPQQLQGKALKNYKMQKMLSYLDSFYCSLKKIRKLLYFFTLSFVFFTFAILSLIFMRNAAFMKVLDKMKLSFINRITQEVVVQYGIFALAIIFAASYFADFIWFLGKCILENKTGVLGFFKKNNNIPQVLKKKKASVKKKLQIELNMPRELEKGNVSSREEISKVSSGKKIPKLKFNEYNEIDFEQINNKKIKLIRFVDEKDESDELKKEKEIKALIKEKELILFRYVTLEKSTLRCLLLNKKLMKNYFNKSDNEFFNERDGSLNISYKYVYKNEIEIDNPGKLDEIYYLVIPKTFYNIEEKYYELKIKEREIEEELEEEKREINFRSFEFDEVIGTEEVCYA